MTKLTHLATVVFDQIQFPSLSENLFILPVTSLYDLRSQHECLILHGLFDSILDGPVIILIPKIFVVAEQV
jgi:hypothetical protein